MLKSNFCDYSDAYILVKGTISHKHRNSSSPNHRTLKAIFKNQSQFTDGITEIKKTKADKAKSEIKKT